MLGIATSHIGLIRSLYCSVFKESSLFKRLDYLTTSQYLLSSIFLNAFEEELRGAAALAATGMMISRMVICVNCFFEIFLDTPFDGQPTIGRPFYGQAKGQLRLTCAFYAECAHEGSEGSKGSKGCGGALRAHLLYIRSNGV